MELNVNINEAAIVDATVQKLMASPKFWDLLRDDLKAQVYQKAFDEFEQTKAQLFGAASERLETAISSRITDVEKVIKTKVDLAVTGINMRIERLTNELVNKATEHLSPINLNRTLGALIREMHGQQLGALIAKSVEKMTESLHQGD